MQAHLDIMQRVLDTGAMQMDRTGIGTLSVFGTQILPLGRDAIRHKVSAARM